MAIRPGLTIKGPGAKDLIASLRSLAQQEVLVGYPAETADRDPVEGEEPTELTNAAIGYIQENGDPDLNIPARPHLGPAIAKNQEGIEARLRKAARAVLDHPKGNQVSERLHEVGLYAQAAVRKEITDGLEPPLAEATLAKRAARGSKGAKKELARRAEGNAPSTQFAKPLIDSGQLRNAVNYVIRNKSERSR